MINDDHNKWMKNDFGSSSQPLAGREQSLQFLVGRCLLRRRRASLLEHRLFFIEIDIGPTGQGKPAGTDWRLDSETPRPRGKNHLATAILVQSLRFMR